VVYAQVHLKPSTIAATRSDVRHDQTVLRVLRASRKGVGCMDLRHAAASLAVASGATVKSVQRMLGHASAALTLAVRPGTTGFFAARAGPRESNHRPNCRSPALLLQPWNM
jgi:integrase